MFPSPRRAVAARRRSRAPPRRRSPLKNWPRASLRRAGRYVLRDCTRGKLQVDIATRRVWAWDGEEERPRCWHLIIRREVGSVTTTNDPAGTPHLAQMQGQRCWVERAFEEAKG
jgi:hypothetical protein